MEEKAKKDYFLPISIVIAAVLIAGSLIYSAGKKSAVPAGSPVGDLAESLPAEKPDISGAFWLGDADAPVAMVEYADFQCPFCGQFFSEVFPSLKKDYIDSGKVKFAQLDFVFLGQESLTAAAAVHCAADQGKSWEFHDLVYQAEIVDGLENNGNLTDDFLSDLASQLEMDSAVFSACLANGKYQEKVMTVTEQGQRAGVRATPTFFINDQKLEGLDPVDPYGSLRAIIDSELD